MHRDRTFLCSVVIRPKTRGQNNKKTTDASDDYPARTRLLGDGLLRFAIRYMTNNATEKVNQLSECVCVRATGSTHAPYSISVLMCNGIL